MREDLRKSREEQEDWVGDTLHDAVVFGDEGGVGVFNSLEVMAHGGGPDGVEGVAHGVVVPAEQAGRAGFHNGEELAGKTCEVVEGNCAVQCGLDDFGVAFPDLAVREDDVGVADEFPDEETVGGNFFGIALDVVEDLSCDLVAGE